MQKLLKLILEIFLKPNSKTDHIEEIDGIWHVKVRAKPKDGEANAYLLKILATHFKIPISKIRLLKGQKSRYKKVEIL